MNIQTYFDQYIAAKRAREMETSPQCTLGDLIDLLSAVEDKQKPVIFNEQYHPANIASWRGSYSELALTYEQEGEKLTIASLLVVLQRAVGATFTGYKGGEFLMERSTPVWVADYGESGGFTGNTQAVTGVVEQEHAVIIKTQDIEY